MTTVQPQTGTPISVSQQMWAINDALQQRIKGYPALVRKGELRQSEADYRIASLQAAFATVAELDTLQRTGPVLAPVQQDLCKAWIKRAAALLDSDARWLDIGPSAVTDITADEVVAVAHLLRDLATLARRADLIA